MTYIQKEQTLLSWDMNIIVILELHYGQNIIPVALLLIHKKLGLLVKFSINMLFLFI